MLFAEHLDELGLLRVLDPRRQPIVLRPDVVVRDNHPVRAIDNLCGL